MALALSQAAFVKPEIRLAQALYHFEAHLSDAGKGEFQSGLRQGQPTPGDVLTFTKDLDERNPRRKGVGPRLTRILQAIQQFSGIIDTVVGGSQSQLAGFLWGAVKTTLFVTYEYFTYFDKLSELLMNIGRSCPRFQEYDLLYPLSDGLRKALCEYFIVVVDLCREAVKFITRPIFGQLSSAVLKPFQTEFGHYEGKLKRCGDAVREEVSLADAKERRLEQTKTSGFYSKMSQYLTDNRRRKNEKTKRRFLDACSRYDHEQAFRQALGRGRSSWIFRTAEYKQWLKPASSMLWCIGILGSGKTVLTANLVRNLLIMASSRSAPFTVSYCFCRYDEAPSVNVREIVGTIVRQLLHSTPPEAFPETEPSYPDSDRMMEHLRKLLPTGAQEYFVIIDGLEECAQPESLIAYLKQLLTFNCKIHIYCSCRPDTYQRLSPDLEPKQNVLMSVSDELEEYIKTELEHRVESGVLRVGDLSIIPKVRDVLIQGSQGMFLWVAFQLDSICAEETDWNILKALDQLPKDLPETFDRVLGKLQRGKGDADLRHRLLNCIFAARRPLTLEELREALSLLPGVTSWQEHRLINDIAGAIPRLCGSLAVIVEEEATVQFAHHSVKQHLSSPPQKTLDLLRIHPAQAESYLGDVCVTYLNLDVFESQITKSRLAKSPVGMNIPNTIAQTINSKKVQSLALAFSKLKGVAQGDSHIELPIWSSPSAQPQYEYAFHKYAKLFWPDHVEGFRLDTQTETYRLYRRLVRGQVSMAEPPWEKTVDAQGVTLAEPPLCWALAYGRVEMAETLLNMDDIEVNAQARWQQTPLLLAADMGYEMILQKLLERDDVDMHAVDVHGNNALMRAAIQGRVQCTKILLTTKDIDVNYQDPEGASALAAAAVRGHEVVAKLLLQAGADANSLYGDEWTPLIGAAMHDHASIVQLFLDQDECDANIIAHRDQCDWTALTHASANGHGCVVDLLLRQHGIDLDPEDKSGFTPLAHAAVNGHKGVCELLLDHGAMSANAKDRQYGRTPLSAAAGWGHEDVVKLLLLQSGVDTEIKDNDGRTPLGWAAGMGHEAVVRLLLQRPDIDVQSKDINGLSPLVWAAGQGKEAVVRLLLQQPGVDADLKDHGGRTPLMWAAANGHESVVRLLLQQSGVDADSKDNNGRTPLYNAEWSGHEAVARLLRSHNTIADPTRGPAGVINSTKERRRIPYQKAKSKARWITHESNDAQ